MPFKNTQLETGKPQTIGERVYATLRHEIILLHLHPGEELNIREIAETLQVSRSPVRDAVMKLSKEGLADILPQKGTRVSRIDPHRVEEERFVRESLEVCLLDSFMQQHTMQDTAQMEALVAKQEQCLKEKRIPDFLDCDEQFHSIFFKAAEKPLCWELIQNMSGHYRRARLLTLWDFQITGCAIEEHRQMLGCIRRQDTPNLTEIEKNHCRRINVQELELFRRYPDYFVSPCV